MTQLELTIYDIVRHIPAGSVATYGQVAEAAGNRNLSRVVGNVMHKNPLPFLDLARQAGWSGTPDCIAADSLPADFEPVPCHRVVNASGRMGANFGLGGPAVQAAMLRLEGVAVTEDLRVSSSVSSFVPTLCYHSNHERNRVSVSGAGVRKRQL